MGKKYDIYNIIKGELIDKLKDKFIIQLYVATTGSVYIKLDGGASGTIRVANHGGKGYKYAYNIDMNVDCVTTKNGSNGRKFYGKTQYNEIIDDAILYRKERVNKYGKLNFRKYVINGLIKSITTDKKELTFSGKCKVLTEGDGYTRLLDDNTKKVIVESKRVWCDNG